MIRETLGEDAIMVATREEQGGKGVVVTAAIDQPSLETFDDNFGLSMNDVNDMDSIPDDLRDDGGWLQYDHEEEQGAVAEHLTDALLKHSVPEEIIDQITSCVTVVGLEEIHIALVAALEHLFVFRPLPEGPSSKTFMLVGPPGSGKTLATAKLAARATLNGLKTCVVSTDTFRAGGVEQLSAFTRILDIPLHKARDTRELREILDVSRGAECTIIDSAGFNPYQSDDLRELARLIAADDIEPVLVLPAGADAEECAEMARIYAALGVRNIMSTRLDVGRRFGGLLSAAYYGGMIFADACDTPQVAGGFFALTPDRLARLLVPGHSTGPVKPNTEPNHADEYSQPRKRTVNAG